MSDAILITGSHFKKQLDQDKKLYKDFNYSLYEWLKKPYIIFANIRPDQKLEIVKSLQHMGHTVALVGTDINDSPSLKQADLGITMGVSGSNAAKESADLVILNDDYRMVVDCIMEGRRLIDNLKKVIIYILSTNLPELLPYILGTAFNIPTAISTVQCLCIDIGSNIYPSYALGQEQIENSVRVRKAEKKHESICTQPMVFWAYLVWGLTQTVAALMVFFAVLSFYGFDLGSFQGIIMKDAYPRPPSDRHYDYLPNALNLGNPALSDDCTLTAKGDYVDWFSTADADYDLRYILIKCNPQTTRWEPNIEWRKCE